MVSHFHTKDHCSIYKQGYYFIYISNKAYYILIYFHWIYKNIISIYKIIISYETTIHYNDLMISDFSAQIFLRGLDFEDD